MFGDLVPIFKWPWACGVGSDREARVQCRRETLTFCPVNRWAALLLLSPLFSPQNGGLII